MLCVFCFLRYSDAVSGDKLCNPKIPDYIHLNQHAHLKTEIPFSNFSSTRATSGCELNVIHRHVTSVAFTNHADDTDLNRQPYSKESALNKKELKIETFRL